jgi:hypothetical protein
MPRALFLSLLLLAPAPGARGEEEPFQCPLKALIAEEDAGLLRVYDGIRRGLEQAHLPRVCLERRPEELGDQVLERVAAEAPPLLFVLGPEARRWLDAARAGPAGQALARVPRVYVDVAWLAGGEVVPAAPALEPPAALVRGVVSAARVREILAEGFGTAGADLAVRETWIASDASRAVVPWLGVSLGATEDARAVLDLRLGPRDPEREARLAAGLPIVSDDIALWRRGAALLVLPDHQLLGRVAADVARRVLEAPAESGVSRDVHGIEVRADLGAAAAAGLVLPLSFLAAVDVLRRGSPGEGG